MTPHIDQAFDPRVNEFVPELCFRLFITQFQSSIILDGEMLVWDPVSERNLPFGTLKTAALGLFETFILYVNFFHMLT